MIQSKNKNLGGTRKREEKPKKRDKIKREGRGEVK
jgi:hypothetical protein